MDDRQPARHRLDHERRAGVVHLGVQEDVSSPEDSRRIALAYSPRTERGRRPSSSMSGSGETTSRPVTRSCASGCRVVRRERPQPELEPVRLGLVASEQQDRTALDRGRSAGVKRPTSTAFGRTSTLRSARRGSGRPSASRTRSGRARDRPRATRRNVLVQLVRAPPAQPGYATPSWLTTIGAPRRRASHTNGRRSRGSHVDPRYRSEKSLGLFGKRSVSFCAFAVPPAARSPGAGTRSCP